MNSVTAQNKEEWQKVAVTIADNYGINDLVTGASKQKAKMIRRKDREHKKLVKAGL